MEPTIFLFDLDDTLLKTYPFKWAQHREAARKFYGLNLSDEILHLHWGKPTPVLVRYLYKDSDSVENMVEKFVSLNHLFPKELHKDAMRITQLLKQRGHRLGIVTNSSSVKAVSDMRRLGLPPHTFELIHGIEQTKTYKPDPNIFAPALQELDLQSKIQHIIYVGDSLHDYEAARGAQLHFIGITRGIVSEAQFRQAGVTHVIHQLDELLEFAIN